MTSTHSCFTPEFYTMALHYDHLICGVILIKKETREIVYLNQVAQKMIKLHEKDIIGKKCYNFICPADKNNCPILDHGKQLDLNEKKLLVNCDKSEIPILKRVSEISIDGHDYLLESFTDISAQKELQNELWSNSQKDPLTGLLNRSSMKDTLHQEVILNKDISKKHSFVVVDVDHFKSINDTFGHTAGDIVLKEFSTILTKSTRSNDKIFRWGGEEFLIWLNGADLEEAVLIAERTRLNIFEHTFPCDIAITASFGIAEYEIMESFENWFLRADKHLLNAKKTGRNKVCY